MSEIFTIWRIHAVTQARETCLVTRVSKSVKKFSKTCMDIPIFTFLPTYIQSHEIVSALLFIYALNWPISNAQKTIYKMQNSQFFDKFLLELLANLSEKDFVQKFSFPWILQVVKVRYFQFYLIKGLFFQILNFGTL